jgi:hypothetical protein
MSKPINLTPDISMPEFLRCHSERSEESQLPMLGKASIFACPREQESLFENNACLTSSPAAPKRLKLLQRFQGSVR